VAFACILKSDKHLTFVGLIRFLVLNMAKGLILNALLLVTFVTKVLNFGTVQRRKGKKLQHTQSIAFHIPTHCKTFFLVFTQRWNFTKENSISFFSSSYQLYVADIASQRSFAHEQLWKTLWSKVYLLLCDWVSPDWFNSSHVRCS